VTIGTGLGTVGGAGVGALSAEEGQRLRGALVGGATGAGIGALTGGLVSAGSRELEERFGKALAGVEGEAEAGRKVFQFAKQLQKDPVLIEATLKSLPIEQRTAILDKFRQADAPAVDLVRFFTGPSIT
jgi:hypothetical protein